MKTNRLKAFSNGVHAIIIPIMGELAAPHAAEIEYLPPLIPVFLSYVLKSRRLTTRPYLYSSV